MQDDEKDLKWEYFWNKSLCESFQSTWHWHWMRLSVWGLWSILWTTVSSTKWGTALLLTSSRTAVSAIFTLRHWWCRFVSLSISFVCIILWDFIQCTPDYPWLITGRSRTDERKTYIFYLFRKFPLIKNNIPNFYKNIKVKLKICYTSLLVLLVHLLLDIEYLYIFYKPRFEFYV